MTGIAKLYTTIVANPRASISFAEFERLLAAAGLVLVRTKGSHHQYVHPAVADVFTVLPDGKVVKPYLVRRFLEIIDEHGLHVG